MTRLCVGVTCARARESNEKRSVCAHRPVAAFSSGRRMLSHPARALHALTGPPRRRRPRRPARAARQSAAALSTQSACPSPRAPPPPRWRWTCSPADRSRKRRHAVRKRSKTEQRNRRKAHGKEEARASSPMARRVACRSHLRPAVVTTAGPAGAAQARVSVSFATRHVMQQRTRTRRRRRRTEGHQAAYGPLVRRRGSDGVPAGRQQRRSGASSEQRESHARVRVQHAQRAQLVVQPPAQRAQHRHGVRRRAQARVRGRGVQRKRDALLQVSRVLPRPYVQPPCERVCVRAAAARGRAPGRQRRRG